MKTGCQRPFRGWLVVAGCCLLWLASAPGHSTGINTFVDFFIADLHLSREEVSFSWLCASAFSASIVTFAGAALDRYGAVRMLMVTLVLYCSVLLLLSRVQTWAQLATCVAAMRFLGPECLILIASATTQHWFVRRRGFASMILSFSDVGLTMTPSLMAPLIASLGGDWRRAYVVLALVIGAVLLAALALIRDRPESVGLFPDGETPEEAVELRPTLEMGGSDPDEALADRPAAGSTSGVATSVSTPAAPPAPRRSSSARRPSLPDDEGEEEEEAGTTHALHERPHAPPLPSASLREAARHRIFWSLQLLYASIGFFWGGFNYHCVSIVRSLGGELSALTPAQTTATIFPLMSLMTVLSRLMMGLVIDRWTPTRRVRAVGGISVLISLCAASVTVVRTRAGLLIFATVYGACMAAQGALVAVMMATLFGTQALGSLSGASVGMGVATTGLGPVVFAATFGAYGSYRPAVLAMASGSLGAAILVIFTRVSPRPRTIGE
jgi:MFS family permease